MKNITIRSIAAISCLGLFATSCTKSKEAKRLFADRHWHRSIKTTVTCYDLATKQHVVSSSTNSSETDTVFAIKSTGNDQIECLGQQLYIYHTGDVDQYIHSAGHGGFGGDISLLYDKNHNKITATTNYNNSSSDTAQQTYCTGESNYSWTSME